MDFLNALPVELALEILHWTDFTTLGRAACVSKLWSSLCSDPSIWPEKYRKTWFVGPHSLLIRRPQLMDWKSLFKIRLRFRATTNVASPEFLLSLFTRKYNEISLEEYFIICESFTDLIHQSSVATITLVRNARFIFEYCFASPDDKLVLAEIPGAIAIMKRAVAKEPTNAHLHNWMGRMYNLIGEVCMTKGDAGMEQRNIELAIGCFERARDVIGPGITVYDGVELDNYEVSQYLANSYYTFVESKREGWMSPGEKVPANVDRAWFLSTLEKAEALMNSINEDGVLIKGLSGSLAQVKWVQAVLNHDVDATRSGDLYDAADAHFAEEEFLLGARLVDGQTHGTPDEMFTLLTQWSTALHTRAEAFKSAQHFDLAIELLVRSIAIKNAAATNLYNLARCYCSRSQLETDDDAAVALVHKASEMYERSIRHEDEKDRKHQAEHEWAFTLFTLGIRFQRHHRGLEAGQLFNQAEEKFTSILASGYSWALYSLSRLACIRGDYTTARTRLEEYVAREDCAVKASVLLEEAKFASVQSTAWFLSCVEALRQRGL